MYEIGFKFVIIKVMNDYVCKIGFFKEKDKNFEGLDYCEGLAVVFFILVLEEYFQFEGQIKDKLGSLFVCLVVDGIVVDKLIFFFMENGELVFNFICKVIKVCDVCEAVCKVCDES